MSIAHLAKIRRAGLRPPSAHLWLDMPSPVPDWHRLGLLPEISVSSKEIARLDLRPFKAIFITVLTETYTDPFWRLLGAFQKVTDGITGYVFDWADEEMGFYLENGEVKTLRDHLGGERR